MFVAETREHLEQLNLAIVRLEEDPKDRGTVEEIFRIAHSLKGMSATMGFSRIAELTHAMEDVFELLRQRTTGLPVEAIDTVFACLDALSVSVESIETDGEESLDPVPLVTRLRSLVRPRTPEQEMARVGIARSARPRRGDRGAGSRRPGAAGARHAQRRSADAGRARAYGPGRARRPRRDPRQRAPADALEQFQGRDIDAWIASEHPDEAIAANLAESRRYSRRVKSFRTPPAAAAPRSRRSEALRAGARSRCPGSRARVGARGRRVGGDTGRSRAGATAAKTEPKARARPAPCASTLSASMR